jgi:ABC-type uncharacterized transport system substrate-binding protein
MISLRFCLANAARRLSGKRFALHSHPGNASALSGIFRVRGKIPDNGCAVSGMTGEWPGFRDDRRGLTRFGDGEYRSACSHGASHTDAPFRDDGRGRGDSRGGVPGFIACLVATLVLSLAAVQTAAAHPHVIVTGYTAILVDKQRQIVGLRHKWTFDDGYANTAVETLEKDANGQPQDKALQELADVNVKALQEFDYFTFPIFHGKRVPLNAPSDYRLEYKDKQMSLFFTLMFKTPVPLSEAKAFSFSVYDSSYFVALSFEDEKSVTIVSDKPTGCKPVLTAPKVEETTLSKMQNEDFSAQVQDTSAYAEKVTLDCKH